MQVILLPSGSGPSRNFRFTAIGGVIAAVLVATGAGGAYLGYNMSRHVASGPPDPDMTLISHAEATPDPTPAPEAAHEAAQSVAATDTTRSIAAAPDRQPRNTDIHPPVVPDRTVADNTDAQHAAANAERVLALRASLDEQRRMLNESRRRLSDQVDSLGQRLGRIQAHVSRLNALGQRLTDMAGLDRGEFSFDTVPAMGGPERPGPWDGIQTPELGETLQMIEIALRDKENELSILEALLTDRELHQKQYPQGWPTAGGGWMSSAYGQRTDPFTGRKAFHEGVDIAARPGSEIRAMAAGVVSFAGKKSGYGLTVEINHGNGYETRYAHAKELIAKVGDRVAKGDAVALVGSTGRSTGSHVHIEVIKNGNTINPHNHLNSAG